MLERKDYELLFEYVEHILQDCTEAKLDVEMLDPALQKLGKGLQKLNGRLNELTEQVKLGKRAKRMESYNELLVELTRKRRERILVVDEETKEIVYCNKKLGGQNGHPEICRSCEYYLSFQDQVRSWNDNDHFTTWEMEAEGEGIFRITTFPIEWQGRSAWAHIIVNITEEKQASRSLKQKAYRDPGTGIYNRLYFEEYMERILQEGRRVTLVYLDLDGLKVVNDRFGHGEGDEYIKAFVAAIQAQFRNTDVFARIGGDEFCLVLADCTQEMAVIKLELVQSNFGRSNEMKYSASFSYGIVEIQGGEKCMSLDAVLTVADEAMYEHKRRKKELN